MAVELDQSDSIEGNMMKKATELLAAGAPAPLVVNHPAYGGDRGPLQMRRYAGFVEPLWEPELHNALEEGLLQHGDTEEWTDVRFHALREQWRKIELDISRLLLQSRPCTTG